MAVRFQNLGSGSTGNASIVAFDGQALIIDCGLPKSRVLAGLHGLRLAGVLITHCHSDHLAPHAQTLGAPVFIEEANWRAAKIRRQVSKRAEHFYEMPFRVGPFRVHPIPLPHPGAETWRSYAFAIEAGGSRAVYATDLGHVPEALLDAMACADFVFLESNHDVRMERESARPPRLKEWVLSDHGHLSNDQCATALMHAKRANTIMLGHLSRQCNTPELALRTARKATRVDVVAAEGDAASAVFSC